MANYTGTALADMIRGTAGADTIRGLGGNDTLDGRGGGDTIDGGAGNDRITGGAGFDTLTGGAGSDTFVYKALADATNFTGATSEWITDWMPEDRVDLSAIDANANLIGNQAFHFAGYSFGEPYHNSSAGNLVIAGFGGELYIMGFTNADSTPDLMIGLWSALGEGGLTVDRIIF